VTTGNVLQSDLPEVSTLIAASIRQSVTPSEAEAQFLIDDIAGCLDAWTKDPSQSIHLKYTVGDAIGGVILVKKYWNLQLLFVDPRHQRRGIGRALVHAVLPECRARSPKAKLMVNSSAVAVPFYCALGFSQTGPGLDRPGGAVPLECSFA
jgi:GNAT superfamily N-acetyltransferase